MRKTISTNLLLTGAGFTRNFGGFLAKEMWSKMFNNPSLQGFPRIKDLLLQDFDYESIYNKVLHGSYNDNEKENITNLIHDVYKELDEIIRQWTYTNDSPYPVNIYGVNKFIERFAGDINNIGMFFTLNQDLFIERHYNSITTNLIHTGVRKIPDAHKIISRLPLEKTDYIRLPTKLEMNKDFTNSLTSSNFHYVKLHGSYGWESSNGINRLVIGSNKESQIADEPLLTYYHNLFKEALQVKNAKLMVIGYGFRDNHINEVLVEAYAKFKLRLYVISPLEQSEFIRYIKSIDGYGSDILNSLNGYFPYDLLAVFPTNQSESHAYREIMRSYFAN